jgi:hypothetical protein
MHTYCLVVCDKVKRNANMDHPSHPQNNTMPYVGLSKARRRPGLRRVWAISASEEPIITLWVVVAYALGGPLSLYFWSSMRASESFLHRYASRVGKATRSIGLASSHLAMQNGEHSIVCAHTSIVAREAKLPYYIIVIFLARSA